MTAAGAAVLTWGLVQCLVVSTDLYTFRQGKHAVIWGAALLVAGRVR